MRGSAAFRTGVAPGGALAGPWVRNPLWNAARSVPSLDLRFADNKSLVDATTGQNLVTFTRASSGTYVDSQGVIRTATTNEARFDHNPTTGESLGLLVEEQRTNSIRNNTMVGAVAGTPGTLPTNWSIASTVNGLTRTIAGVGTINGISYIDVHFAGTATATANLNYLNDSSTTSPALNGQTWTFSTWVSYTKNSGSDPVLRLEIDERDSSGNFLAATQTPITPGQTFVRYSTTRTNNNALTAFELAYVQAAYVSGQSYDFTLRIGLPQLEQGAFATSVIPTTTATVTRSADVASITGSNFSSWYRQNEGTVFAQYQQYAAGGTAVNISDNTGSNFINIFTSAAANTQSSANVFTSGTNNGRIDSGGTFVANFSVKSAYGLSAGSRSLSAQGNAASTSATPATLPTVNRINIGVNQDATSGWNNGTIRRLCYWSQRLPNSTLQQITQ